MIHYLNEASNIFCNKSGNYICCHKRLHYTIRNKYRILEPYDKTYKFSIVLIGADTFQYILLIRFLFCFVFRKIEDSPSMATSIITAFITQCYVTLYYLLRLDNGSSSDEQCLFIIKFL